MNNGHIIDYYEVLESKRNAAIEELKRNYQRLILMSHPDKVNDVLAQKNFHLIQEAWNVLRDPESRKQYDANLECLEHNEVLLFDTVKLCDMSFTDDKYCYSYSCRCGGTYILEASAATNSPEIVIDCDECSFSIKVVLQNV